ncbi:extracellular matrix organizing protein FRAS1-like isoform X2 [Periplaneta americana]
MMQYFEINGTDNENPDVRFVITEMPQSGTLILSCSKKSSLNLEGGVEFSLQDLKECVVQYEHNKDDGNPQDMFEILATVGQYELTNNIHLKINPQEDSTNFPESEGSDIKKVEYMLQFGTNQHVIIVQENCSFIRIPVQRWGDLSTEAQVLCYTMQRTATAGKDFVDRPRNSADSILIFSPKVTMVECQVTIIDDEVYEAEEELELRLENFHGIAGVALGENTVVTLKIVDFEDTPKVQFDREEIIVSEPVAIKTGDATSTITVNVVRSGDVSQEARVRVSTCDHSASAGVDYEPLSQMLVFSPGTKTLPIRVRVIHRPTRTQTQTFSLVLSPKELTGVELGELSSITIKVNRGISGEAMKVLPSQPIIVSLLEYDNVKSVSQVSDPSPGYPLVCISSCNARHPHFSTTGSLCKSGGIEESNIAYSWEVAVPSLNRRSYSAFRPIRDSTIYGNVYSKVLDPLFYSRKFRLKCVTTPFVKSDHERKIMGIPLKSKHVTIGSEREAICSGNDRQSNGDYLQEHSFVAILRYIDSSSAQDVNHKNTIHVHLEIPHSDGMVPLVSTLPLRNPRILLLDRRHTAQHLCSNLHNNSAFLINEEVLKPPPNEKGFSRPYQLSSNMRGNDTVKLYKHLNLNTCLWTFDAWFHMSQLVDNCGGKVTSEFQVEANSESYVTVQVPLYVTYVTASAPRDWMAVEHRSELEVSFYYTSMLWQGGLNTQPQYEAAVQIVRVSADEDGRLVVDFGTVAQFRGCFVISHHSLPGVMSEVVPPSDVNTNFTLHLVWSQTTWDGPEQTWRAISIYSLQDYSGEYTIKLIPCTVLGSQQYQRTQSRQISDDCTPHTPAELKLPIVFKQSSRPTPLVYNLNTYFTLSNDRAVFVSRPSESDYNVDYTGVFSPGDAVYGRVLWHASQHLHSAYSLAIQRLYLCAGADGYIPRFDPNNAGSQYGCLQTSPKIKHSFLLLDRDNPYSADKYYNDIPLEVYFASDLPEYEQVVHYSGVDGFILKVDPLYRINSGYTWYLQVLYTIGAASHGRGKRSIAIESIPISDLQNRTDMKSLRLRRTAVPVENSPKSGENEQENMVLMKSLLISAVVIIFAVVSLLAKLRWNTDAINLSGYSTSWRNQVPLNSELQSNAKVVKVRSIPAVTVWNDIRGMTTEV